MAEQVGHGDALGSGGIAQVEAGHVVGDFAVPTQRTIVDQQPGHGAGECLGQRSKAEHGMRVDGLWRGDIGHAVTARAQHAAVLHDGHGQAGHTLAHGQGRGHVFESGDIKPLRQWQHALVGQVGAVGHGLRRGNIARGGWCDRVGRRLPVLRGLCRRGKRQWQQQAQHSKSKGP